jgi:hypothetical protein
MKIHLKRTQEQGSVLLVALLTCSIMGVVLASYLIMTSTQNRSVMRSQNWNSTIAMTEAGIEDGLQLINKYAGAFEKLTNWPSTATADNWSVNGNVFYVRRYMGENYYDVWVTNSADGLNPSVCSIGYNKWHYHIASASGPAMFAAANVTQPRETSLSRTVDVRAKVDPIFNVAMAANRTIDFNGKNIFTDSFDSSDPNYSNNGLYPFGLPSKQKDNGDVVTNDTLTNSLSVGNAKIKGQVKVGPKGGASINNGSVGDKAWVDGGNVGIQPGKLADDMNVVFPAATLPAGNYLTPIKGAYIVNGVTYDYVLASGDYKLNTLGSGNFKMLIQGTAGLPTRLYVYSDIFMTGTDVIRITSGSSLKIYMSGSSAKFGGNGVINENGYADSFYYFGLNSNTSVNFSGNSSFTGVVYAPNADFQLGGGGSDVYDFIGASVTKSVRMNGHYKFHYDEALRNNGMGRGYIPTIWKES